MAAWTVRPKPQDDELLSSWMIRTAAMSGQKLHSWSTDHWRTLQLWNRDLDMSAPDWLVDAMAEGTATNRATAYDTLLRSLEGTLYPTLDRSGIARFVRPLGVYHRTRRGFGQWYCPRCLASDAEPYFRRRWRLVGFPCCTRHGIVLLDRCPSCTAPVVPHRGELHCCHVCEGTLALAAGRPADPAAIQFQHEAQRILAGAPVTATGLTGLHPLLFFALLNRLISLVLIGPRRSNLQIVIDQFVSPPLQLDRGSELLELRFIGPSDTHEALRATAILIRGWPDLFVGIMQEARLWWSWAIKDADPASLPFAFIAPARQYLQTSSPS